MSHKKKLQAGEVHTLATIADRCIEEGDCLLWQGACNNGTKPVIYDKATDRIRPVRHYIFTTLLGKTVPRGRLVSFTCDNTLCVAKEHIATFTRAELTAKAAEVTQYHLRPERSAKLAKAAQDRSHHTWEEVAAVRAAEGRSSKAVAREMGLPKHFVTSVRSHRSWKATTPFTGLGARQAANESNERKRA